MEKAGQPVNGAACSPASRSAAGTALRDGRRRPYVLNRTDATRWRIQSGSNHLTEGVSVDSLATLPRYRAWLLALALGGLAAACGRDPILGNAGLAALAPTVIAVTPANGAIGVVPTKPDITATLSEAVGAFTGAASFTVTCAAPCVNPVGTVTLDAADTTATYTVTAGSLAGLTLYNRDADRSRQSRQRPGADETLRMAFHDGSGSAGADRDRGDADRQCRRRAGQRLAGRHLQ